MAESPEPKKFQIKVIYNGVEKSLDVNPNESVQAVLEGAIKLHWLPVPRRLLVEVKVDAGTSR